MLIALDYDATYNAAPEQFDKIIALMKTFGWKVILATYRHSDKDYHPLFDHLKSLGVKCYFTDGKGKKEYLKNLGIEPNIWFDDNPRSILEDSAWEVDSPELNAWREAQKASGGIKEKAA